MLVVTIADYELLTGTDVPAADEPMVQATLDVISSVVWVYLGASAEAVDAAYHDVLVYLVVTKAQRVASIPAGIRSESVGSTSVAYIEGSASALYLTGEERSLLDALMGRGSSGRYATSVIVPLG